MGGEVAGGEVVAVGAELGLEVSTQRPVPKLRLRYRGGGGGVAGGGAGLLARAAPQPGVAGVAAEITQKYVYRYLKSRWKMLIGS